MAGYLVVEEYQEQYAPGNIMTDFYWQQHGPMFFFTDALKAHAHKLKLDRKQSAQPYCVLCPPFSRTKIYSMAEGKAFQFDRPNQDEDSDSEQDDEDEEDNNDNLEDAGVVGLRGCEHTPPRQNQEGMKFKKEPPYEGCIEHQGPRGSRSWTFQAISSDLSDHAPIDTSHHAGSAFLLCDYFEEWKAKKKDKDLSAKILGMEHENPAQGSEDGSLQTYGAQGCKEFVFKQNAEPESGAPSEQNVEPESGAPSEQNAEPELRGDLGSVSYPRTVQTPEAGQACCTWP